MKLKYKAWTVTGPRRSQLEIRSRFPFEMLRYDPAYIHDEALAVLLGHFEKGGERINTEGNPDSYIMICTALPGYNAKVMTPTVGRWASFGWGNIEQLIDADFTIEDPRHWNTVIGFSRSLDPVFLTLQDFIDCKTMNDWSNKIRTTKQNYDCVVS